MATKYCMDCGKTTGSYVANQCAKCLFSKGTTYASPIPKYRKHIMNLLLKSYKYLAGEYK